MKGDWKRYLEMDPDEAVRDDTKRTKFKDEGDAFRGRKKIKKFRNRKRDSDPTSSGEWE